MSTDFICQKKVILFRFLNGLNRAIPNFATILGTVSGLIIASSGAIAHDLIDNYMGKNQTDKQKVRAGKIAAFAVGIMAIALGISAALILVAMGAGP